MKKEYIDSFTENMRCRRYSEKSIEKYSQNISKFCKYLEKEGIKRIQSIDKKVLELYRLYLYDAKYSSHSIESYLQTVRQFFNFLENEAVIFENPASELIIRRGKPSIGYVMSEQEVKQLLDEPDITNPSEIRDKAILEVLYSTGIRRAELTGMNIDDLNLSGRSVRIFGKGSKERILPLGKHAVCWLNKFINSPRKLFLAEKKSKAVWINYRGEQLSEQSIRLIVKKYVMRAGLNNKITTHTLRRSCATHMLRNGAHPSMVSMLLGHADIRTLSHYLQVSITDLMKTHRQTGPGQ